MVDSHQRTTGQFGRGRRGVDRDVPYPHALEPGERPQWPEGSQRPQGLDGGELRVAQSVSYQANQGHLRRGRRLIRPDK